MTTSSLRLQRASGESRVAFDLRDGRTRLADLYQRDPCRVLFPQSEPGEPPQAVHLTTSRGVTDGDSLKMAVDLMNGNKPAETTVLLDPKLITADNIKEYKGWTAAR